MSRIVTTRRLSHKRLWNVRPTGGTPAPGASPIDPDLARLFVPQTPEQK